MSNPAFSTLSKLASLCSKTAAGTPEKTNAAPRWSGIGFSLLGFKFVVPMGQISELLEVPSVTVLPGVQPWVSGLANVRGRLLPLFDLAAYFNGNLTLQKKQHRVLILETANLYTGLIIDQSHGMQHFDSTEFLEMIPSTLTDSMTQYVHGSYKDANGEPWTVFDFSLLEKDNRFTNAALVYPLSV